MIYHCDNPKAMNSSKSEDSILPSEFSHKPEPESPQKMLARRNKLTYGTASFSRPFVDQLKGILPAFNNRLSQDRDLGFTSSGYSRLSPETLPRLMSDSCSGFSTSNPPEVLSKGFEISHRKEFGITPDFARRTLSGTNICPIGIGADLPLAPLGSRLVDLRRDGLEEKKVE